MPKNITIGVCRFRAAITAMTIEKINGKNRTVISVPSFDELMRLVGQIGFNLIIMGLGQNGEGLKIISEIKRRFPQIKIWVFSKAGAKLLKQAEELGAEKVFSALDAQSRREFNLALDQI